MIGAAERAGGGSDKILNGWNETNFRKPYLQEQTKPSRVQLELPIVSLLSDSMKEFLISIFGEKVLDIERDKLMILATCCVEGDVSNYRLGFVINKHSVEITRILKEMCNDAYLVSEGNGRGTIYKIKGFNPSKEASKETIGRLNRNDLYELILNVCTEFETLEKIATQTGKNSKYLKDKVIPLMIVQNMIEREFPDIPRHPHQRYKRKQKD